MTNKEDRKERLEKLAKKIRLMGDGIKDSRSGKVVIGPLTDSEKCNRILNMFEYTVGMSTQLIEESLIPSLEMGKELDVEKKLDELSEKFDIAYDHIQCFYIFHDEEMIEQEIILKMILILIFKIDIIFAKSLIE